MCLLASGSHSLLFPSLVDSRTLCTCICQIAWSPFCCFPFYVLDRRSLSAKKHKTYALQFYNPRHMRLLRRHKAAVNL